MIQRSQTIWLLVAAVCAFISLNTAFYSGTPAVADVPVTFIGKTNLLILISTVICGTLSVVNIFLYKNRPLQLKLVIANLLLSIVLIVLYFNQIKNYSDGVLALLSVIVFLIPLSLLLAARGIYRDNRLVKNADRLR